MLVRGAGTKLDWGHDPARCDLVLDTTSMERVVEHAAGDLVVHVEAGVRLSALQDVLAEHGQQLALDAPFGDGTVGGAVATGASGPRRLLYGTPRDLLIGVTVVRADGVVAKSGGKVVKNVAGYDLGRLLTGSFGTLAVITEAVFRLHPLPRASAYLTATYDSPPEAGRAVAAVVGSQTAPTAVEVHRATRTGPVDVGVLVEGVPAGVDARTAAVAALLGESEAAEQAPPWWGAYAPDDRSLLLRLSAPPGETAAVLTAVERLAGEWAVDVSVNGSAAGTVFVAVAGGTPLREGGSGLVRSLRDAAGQLGGALVVLDAPAATKDALDVWGPVEAIDLMRRVKEQLDPGRRLSPGRFVGGI
jgi:glycolate oxidase FAD binding subunit